jgi:hypothetical protein
MKSNWGPPDIWRTWDCYLNAYVARKSSLSACSPFSP